MMWCQRKEEDLGWEIFVVDDSHVGRRRNQSDEGKRNRHLPMMDFFWINNNRRTVVWERDIYQSANSVSRRRHFFSSPLELERRRRRRKKKKEEHTSIAFNSFILRRKTLIKISMSAAVAFAWVKYGSSRLPLDLSNNTNDDQQTDIFNQSDIAHYRGSVQHISLVMKHSQF